jgi:hypothetical protein
VTQQFFGKYRGTVENNVDPLQQGRIQVSVPAVLGSEAPSWAMPCLPVAGRGVGFFALPPTGANVWVEFEAGHPNRPIWVGGFWGVGEAPALPAVPQMTVLKTPSGTVTINDLPGVGGITIETTSGVMAILAPLGIEINNGLGASIVMKGPKITINNGAMEII